MHAALLCSPSEDDKENLSSLLAGFKVQAVSADDATEALKLARDSRFILILLDLDRDSHWRTTIKTLQQCAPRAGVLAYSEIAGEHQWLDALDAGAFDFVCKPFRRRELHWIVESALKSHR